MSPFRVIGGRAKGRALRLPPETTRPTSHKVRGAALSMLEAQLWRLGELGWEGARVLDLFAGSGAYGIEALSRGAAWVDFVEQDAKACRVIAENLARAGFSDQARIHCCDATVYLRRGAAGPLPYAIIVADPPYDYARLDQVLREVGARGPLGRLGLVVLEARRTVLLPTDVGGLQLLRSRRHGDTTLHLFLWRREMPADAAQREADEGGATAPGGVSGVV